ncbi:MAG: hypothetical protein NC203_03420 [Firmicutes bacterium]|nr:hypothetical protein [Bacillota bacterium]
MVTASICENESILSYLGILGTVIGKSKFHLRDICEIRLRAGRPIVLETTRGRFALDRIASFDEINECMKGFCHYSMHSYEKEMREGYITLKGGHRAGFCGNAVIRDNTLENVKDISSINLRIAREVMGCGEVLKETVFKSNFKGLIICGRPMSGKTTVLRDICRIIGNKSKLSVIDSRGEIAAVYGGIPQNDVGIFTDVLTGYEKEQGIEIAVRTLSPEYIACDEITGASSYAKLCSDSGARLLFTLHCSCINSAMECKAVKSGVISHIALLGGKLGQIAEIAEI